MHGSIISFCRTRKEYGKQWVRRERRSGEVSPAGPFDFNQKLGSVNNRRTLASCSLLGNGFNGIPHSISVANNAATALALISGSKLELQRFKDDHLPINFLIHAFVRSSDDHRKHCTRFSSYYIVSFVVQNDKCLYSHTKVSHQNIIRANDIWTRSQSRLRGSDFLKKRLTFI